MGLKHYASLWSKMYNCCQVESNFSDVPVYKDNPCRYLHLLIR